MTQTRNIFFYTTTLKLQLVGTIIIYEMGIEDFWNKTVNFTPPPRMPQGFFHLAPLDTLNFFSPLSEMFTPTPHYNLHTCIYHFAS